METSGGLKRLEALNLLEVVEHHLGRDSAHAPVAHALNRPWLLIEPEQARKRLRAAGQIDELGGFLWVHGRKITPGVYSSQVPCVYHQQNRETHNRAMRNLPTHPTYIRLEQAFLELFNDEPKPGRIARWLGISAQVAYNWKKRGVPQEALPDLEYLTGVSTTWITHGQKPILRSSAALTDSVSALQPTTYAPRDKIHALPQSVHEPAAARSEQGAQLAHHLPVLSQKDIMLGATGEDPPPDADIETTYSGPAGVGSFVYISDTDHMAGGRVPIHRGYHVVLDPTLAAKAGRVALVSIAGGPPVLRRIDHDGVQPILAAEDVRLTPRPLDASVVVYGVMRTAYPPPEQD